MRRHVEHGRHEQGRRGQGQLGACCTSGSAVEALPLAGDPPEEEGEADDREHVAQNRADERGFHEVVQAGLQRDDGDDELGGIAEGGVEQAARGRAKPAGQLLGGDADEAGQRHDGQAAGEEHDGRAPVPMLGSEGERRRQEQEIEGVQGHAQALHWTARRTGQPPGHGRALVPPLRPHARPALLLAISTSDADDTVPAT